MKGKPSSHRTFQVHNLTRGTVLATAAALAESFAGRARGLLWRQELLPGHGLLLRPCRCVHMWGMRFSIDAVYVSGTGVVLAAVPDLRPGMRGPFVRRAEWVLEVRAGTIAATATCAGDLLEVL